MAIGNTLLLSVNLVKILFINFILNQQNAVNVDYCGPFFNVNNSSVTINHLKIRFYESFFVDVMRMPLYCNLKKNSKILLKWLFFIPPVHQLLIDIQTVAEKCFLGHPNVDIIKVFSDIGGFPTLTAL